MVDLPSMDAITAGAKRYGLQAFDGLSRVPYAPIDLMALFGHGMQKLGLQEGTTVWQDMSNWRNQESEKITGVKPEDRGFFDNLANAAGGAAFPVPAVGLVEKLLGPAGKWIDAFATPGTVAGPGFTNRALASTAIGTGISEALQPSTAQAAPAPQGWTEINPAVTEAPTTSAPADGWTETKPETQVATSAPAEGWTETNSNPWYKSAPAIAAGTAAAVGAGLLAARGMGARSMAANPAKVAPDVVAEAKFVNRAAPLTAMAENTTVPGSPNVISTGDIERKIFYAPQQSRVMSFLESGSLEGSLIDLRTFARGQMQSPARLMREIGEWAPEKLEDLKKALNYGSELDNRKRVATANSLQGSTITSLGTDQSINFRDIRTDDMQREWARLKADPDIANAVRRMQDLYKQAGELLVEQGLVSRDELTKMRTANPNYSHVRGADPLLARVLDNYAGLKGIDVGDPLQSFIEYFEKVHRAVDQNNLRKGVIDQATRWQMANPNAAPIVERVLGPGVKEAAEEVGRKITFVEGGEVKTAIFSDPAYVKALTDSPQVGGLAMQTLNKIRHFLQSTTTGPAAALVSGAVFAPTSAIYSGTVGSISRQAGTSLGLADSLMQKVTTAITGVPIGLRGDPTWMAQAVYRIGADSLAEMSGAMARTLRTSLDSDGRIVAMFGQQRTAAAADAFAKSYEQSMLARMRQAGAGNAGLYASADVAFENGQRIGKDYLSQLAIKAADPTMPHVQTAWRAWKSFYDIIGSSANSAYFAQNVGKMSDADLAMLTRKLGGDPAISGYGSTMQAAGKVVPYFGVGVQGAANMIGAITRPNAQGAAAFAGLVGLTSGAALSYVSYLNSLGPEYVADFFGRSPEDTASGLPMYIPGQDPRMAAKFPIANEIAPLVVPMVHGLATLSGAKEQAFPSPFIEQMNERMGFATKEAMMASLRRAIPFQPGRDPVTGVATLLMGGSPGSLSRGDVGPIKGTRSGSLEGTQSRYNSDPSRDLLPLPGRAVEEAAGLLGRFGSTLVDAYVATALSGTAANIPDRVGDAMFNRAADNNPLVRPLWGVAQKESRDTADMEWLREYDKRAELIGQNATIRRNEAQYKQGVLMEGRGPVRWSQMMTDAKLRGDVLAIDDITATSYLANRVHSFHSAVVKPAKEKITARYDLLNHIRSGDEMSFSEKRAREDQITQEIKSLNADLLLKIGAFENGMRRDPLLAGKFTSIRDYDPSRTLGGRPIGSGTVQ